MANGICIFRIHIKNEHVVVFNEKIHIKVEVNGV